MQQQNNYHYTFEELQTYLYSYADLFQQDRVQDGVHLYSKNAKNIFKEMQKVNDKINKKKEKYNKKMKEKRAKMVEAMQAYTKKHRDDKNCDKNMLEDPYVKRCQDEMKKLEAKLDNAVKVEQDKFMQWEKKEMKGQNVIIRNNNYISAAGKSNAINKGLIRSNEIASFGNVNIQNSKNETISGNLADIVHSVTNLLHQKAQAEKDKEKKSEIEKVIQVIINGVKKFFGIRTDNKEELKKQSDRLNQALTIIIEKYLDNNFKQVQINLDVIKQKNEQGKINYQSETKDIYDVRSDLSSDNDDIISQITNENKNIDTAKLLDKKAKENKSRSDISQDNNIKSSVQDKNKTADMQEKEISTEELDKLANEKFDKESQNINQGKLSNPTQQNKEDLEEPPADEYKSVVPKNHTDKLNSNFISNSNLDQINKNASSSTKPNSHKNKISFDMPGLEHNNKQSTLNNDKSNNKPQTNANNIKISISEKNNAEFNAPTINNGKMEAKGAQIGGSNSG